MSRFFRSGNRSQASIDRAAGSRSSSPDLGGAQVDRFGQQTVRSVPYHEPGNQVQHPAHVHTRISPDAPEAYVDTDRRPSVPITQTQPLSPRTATPPQYPSSVNPGQTQFGQTKHVTVHTEKEHKKSKRSIFGLGSKDKDHNKENSPTDKKNVLGRSGSVNLLRKNVPQAQSPSDTQSYNQQSTQQQPNRNSAFFGRPGPSTENLPEDPSYYDQYRNPQGQYDLPQRQSSQRSPEYSEDSPQYPTREQAQQQLYRPYQQPPSANTSESFIAYQGGHQGRPSQIAIDQSLRPPSQSSLGPPSPLIQPTHLDSRPSTAATSRYSTQSVGQGQHPQGILQQQQMARGDPPNGASRSRDPREDQYQQDPRVRMSQHTSEHGRNTPPPRNREDPRDFDFEQLLQKHEELQAKYSKVKRYYFDREAQVTQLQNTVANQRLSLSKTSLDDAQYVSRFERMSGAINNLAFNIRKEWKNVPPWLRPVCNKDACDVGTKEMTAIGRACITRWLYETVFEQIFHPGIDKGVSMHLKHIEKNLRKQGQSGAVMTDEQKDDLLTKIMTWRLTTIEGLQDHLNSRFSTQHEEMLTQQLTMDLTNSLKANLKEGAHAGLQENVFTIIQQAVSITRNIPMESRDVCIEYFMPGAQINETYMKVETGMTPLTNPGSDERSTFNQTDANSEDEGDRDVEAEIREAAGKASSLGTNNGQGRAESVISGHSQTTLKSSKDASKQKSGFLGGFVGSKPKPAPQQSRSQVDVRGPDDDGRQTNAIVQDSPNNSGSSILPSLVPGEGKIRLAAFLTVEVRGKKGDGVEQTKDAGSAGIGSARGVGGGAVNVLVKASVYEL